jgi:hypothetical protein
VPLDDRLRDRKAEAGPRNRVLLRAGAAEEPLEELVLLLGRKPEPGVLDLDDGRVVDRLQPDLDPPAGRGELERVRDEVVENLREPGAIALQPRDLLRPRDQRDALRARGGQRGLDALLDDLLEIDGPEIEGELARIDLRDTRFLGSDGARPRARRPRAGARDSRESRSAACAARVTPAR